MKVVENVDFKPFFDCLVSQNKANKNRDNTIPLVTN